LLICVDALHRDVVKGGGDRNPAGVVEHLLQCRVSFELINRRTPDHAEDGDLRTSRRNEQSVAGLEALVIHAHAVQQKAIKVHFSYQLLSAVVAHDTQRADTSRATRLIDGVEWSGEGTHVIGAGALHVADHIHPHRAQAGNRNIDLGIVILLLERAFNVRPGLL
jgi:hypothetical protein